MIVNMGVKDGVATNQTRISKVDTNNGNCIQEILPDSECRTAVLSNLYVSQGQPGKVGTHRTMNNTKKLSFTFSLIFKPLKCLVELSLNVTSPYSSSK